MNEYIPANATQVTPPNERADFKCDFINDGMVCATTNIQIDLPKTEGAILLEQSTYSAIGFFVFCMFASIVLLALLKVHKKDIEKIEKRSI